jgi:hypothetical protein
MEPADLLELTLILAEAAAEVLRERNTPGKAVSESYGLTGQHPDVG